MPHRDHTLRLTGKRWAVVCLAFALIALPITLRAQAPPKAPNIDQPTGAVEAGATPEGEANPAAAAGDADSATDEGAGDASEASGDPNAESGVDSETDARAEEDSEGEKSILRTGLLGLFLDGGVFMWPIALMGLLAIGVIIERYRSLKMVARQSDEVRDAVLKLLREDRIEEALQLCESEQGPVPAVLSSGLRKYYVLRRLGYDPASIEPQVVKSMDDYSIHIVAALEKNLAILATISSAAPMLGFLGTVQGMINSFRDIVEQMGETNIVEAAAAGIQVSLLTTCFGLIVGIPAFVAFNYFTSLINRYVLDVEESATDLVEQVTLQMALSERTV